MNASEYAFDCVRRCFGAYASGDRAAIEALLADDFVFTRPYDDHIDRQIYFERCWSNAHRLKGHEIKKLAGDGREVFVLYECETVDGRVFRNVELFRFDGGKIKSVEVYFSDTA